MKQIFSVWCGKNRAVLPHMRRQGSGLLLHVSSGAGRMVVPGLGLYCASKFALEALAESYRYELALQGIDSVVVEPGAYPTAIFANLEQAADKSRTTTYGAVNEIPQKIVATLSGARANPQEVADAVLRLIEMPAGQRPLRQRIGPGDSLREINAASELTQKRLLEAFGVTSLTAFRARTASAD